MGGGGGGKGGGGTTVQQVQIPPEVLARYNAVNAKAEEVAATPFQPYTGEFVAPLNQTQQAGINATSQASQMAQPYYGAATQATLGGMQNVGPLTQQQIDYYQNPYTQAVVDPTLRALQQQQGQQLSEQQSQAIQSGAFGGDRSGIARATLQGQQNLALGQAIAPLYQQGYNTAVQTAMGQQGVVAADLARQLTGGQQLGNLGSAAQQAALSGAQAQIAAGTLPQQTQQAQDTAQYQQFQQEKGYPFQTTQFLANIAEGTGALSGNTTTQTQGGGFFSSDARLKENIEPIGELFDGQTVYRYNYKDDKHKKAQIGLIAQEAAKEKKPGVGVDNDGYLAVNYHDATDEAADAGKGLVPNSMGGAVRSAGAFARGGYATDGGVDFGSLVAAHAKLYDEGKKKEAGLNIPTQGSAPKSLQVQPMLNPQKKENPIKSAMEMGQGVAKTGEAVKKISEMSPIKGTKAWWAETFGDKTKAATPGAQSPATAKGSPGAPSPAATAAPTKTTGLVPSGDKLTTPTSNQLALGPDLGPNAESFNRPAPTGVAPQQYADSGQTMNDAGRQPYLPDANNNVDVAYSGQAYELPQTAAQPPLQGIQAQNAAFEGTAGQGQDLGSAVNESLANAGNDGMDFASSLDNLGDFAGYGSDMADIADVADVGDLGSSLGDVMAFVKRGGRIGHYANGGLIPRQHYAGKGFVTPGYDTEHNPDDIMDTVVEEGEQPPGQLEGESKNFAPPMHSSSGGGGGGGFNPMSAIGPAISLFGMFSDARLKHNIEPVGKTYDGQNIYRYDFGDGNTQLGLIAQEVAKHKPHAVSKKNGYLTVDYKHATESAAPRHAYADGGGNSPLIDTMQAYEQARSSRPNELPLSYNLDDGTQVRGSGTFSGPFTEYGAGLGVDLGGGRLNMDAARGSAPGSQPQYRGKLGWSKNFASGGLVPREYHNGEDGNVVGQNFDREAVAAAANDDEPVGLDPRLMALAPDTSQPRNVRNNNPGNLEDSSWTQKQPGYVGTDGRFAIFETPEHGSQAMQTLIGNKASKGMNTPASLITSWASEPGSPPPEAYINHVAKTLGIGPNDPFDASDPAVREKLASAMYQFEGGNTVKGEAAPRPPKDVGPSEPGLGSFLSGKSGKGKFDGVEAKNASLGDVFREYAPSAVPTSEDFWMPALGFLGGMLSSPNPKFLGALGSGLVSGVSTQFEMDRLNQERAKNAFNLIKDRFEDAVGTDANGLPMAMKRDKYDGKLYSTDQMGAIQASLLKSMGVNPAQYGMSAGATQPPAKGDKAVAPPTVAASPAQGEAGAAQAPTKAPDGSTIPPVKAADPVVQEALAMYPKPPENIDPASMTPAQLKANAFWNWKESGLSENPQAILANIRDARAKAKAWSDMGASGVPKATQLENYIKSEQERLGKMLDEAVAPAVARNTEILKSTIGDAKEYGNKIQDRTAVYREKRNQLMSLAQLQAEGLQTGYGAETMRNIESLYSTVTGGKEMPFFFNNKDKFDYASKIAAAQVVNSIKDAGLQRSPAAGLKTESRIVPGPNLSSGAIHELIGNTLGDMDYAFERDQDYVKNHRWQDPTTFLMNYDSQNKNGYAGDHRYNKKVADAFSSLPIPEGIPEVVDSLRRKYGETAEIDYGYRPKTQKDVAPAAAASSVAPGQKVGDRKQFKQGWGVWNGSQWIPEGQQ